MYVDYDDPFEGSFAIHNTGMFSHRFQRLGDDPAVKPLISGSLSEREDDETNSVLIHSTTVEQIEYRVDSWAIATASLRPENENNFQIDISNLEDRYTIIKTLHWGGYVAPIAFRSDEQGPAGDNSNLTLYGVWSACWLSASSDLGFIQRRGGFDLQAQIPLTEELTKSYIQDRTMEGDILLIASGNECPWRVEASRIP